ncbi:hypothetical protein JVU11DRAFT_2183 [Chiua virens]|nr:hypothetical protein JVU11DRAFT_12730 [Chiua virens]KAG9317950.1 hypothetical protein JVU11DRAFT_2183 [Chiua virens]
MPHDKKLFQKVAYCAATDAVIISLLYKAEIPFFQDAITTELASLWHSLHPAPHPPMLLPTPLEPCQHCYSNKANLFAEFIQWTGNQWIKDPDNQAFQLLFTAWHAFKKAKDQARSQKRALIRKLRLKSSAEQRKNFIKHLPEIKLVELPKPYPPKGFWWYESGRALQKWEMILTQGKQADKRKKRFPLLKIDSKQLQHTVPSGSSAIIRDAKTGELVLMVVRDFCQDLGVLNWADGVVREVIGHKRSVRLEDPGKLALIGYSAGALSAPKFDWVRNLLSSKMPTEAIEELDTKSSAVFALFGIYCRVLFLTMFSKTSRTFCREQTSFRWVAIYQFHYL